MKVTLETLEGLKRRLKVEIPVEKVNSAYETKLNEAASKAKLPGYRPGKIPISKVKARFGPSILHQVTETLLKDTLFKAIEQTSVKMAGEPVVEKIDIDENKPFIYEAALEVFPEDTIKDLSGVEIEKMTAEVTDSDVKEAMDALAKNHATFEVVDRPAKEDDKITLNYDATIEGKPLPDFSSRGQEIVVGEAFWLPAVAAKFKGAKAGDQFEITTIIPNDFGDEEMPDKPATFNVSIVEVKGAKPAVIDDAFAEKMDIKEGGAEALKQQLRNKLEDNLAARLKTDLKEKVFKLLKEANPILLPGSLIKRQVRELQMRMVRFFEMMNIPKKPEEISEDSVIDEAKDRIHVSLLISLYKDQNNITLNDAQMDDAIKKASKDYDNPDGYVDYAKRDEDTRHHFESMVLEDQIVDALLASAKVIEKKMSYQEVMNKKPENQPEEQVVSADDEGASKDET